jgi:hypothetical protein
MLDPFPAMSRGYQGSIRSWTVTLQTACFRYPPAAGQARAQITLVIQDLPASLSEPACATLVASEGWNYPGDIC